MASAEHPSVWSRLKGTLFTDELRLYFYILFSPRGSIVLSGFLGAMAATLFTGLLFPATLSLLGAGLLIPLTVGLLIGLEVAIILNFLLRDEKAMDNNMRRMLMWFAILLAPISMAALGLTLALGVAPGLLFVSGPGGWIVLGLVAAAIGLLVLAGVFALASTAGTGRGVYAWRDFKDVLRSFHRGFGEQLDKNFKIEATQERRSSGSLAAQTTEDEGQSAEISQSLSRSGSFSQSSMLDEPEAGPISPLTVEIPERKEPLRIMIVGAQSSGKTTLVQKLTGNHSYRTGPTIDIGFYKKKKKGSDLLQIWDTSGNQRYQGFMQQCYRGKDAVMLTYDVNDKGSLEALQAFLPKLVEELPPGTPMMLVACKKDAEPASGKERVTSADVERFIGAAGKQYQGIKLSACEIPTSAKTGEGVDAAFAELAEKAMSARAEATRTRSPS